MQIFVISLADAHQRRQMVSRRMADAGLEFAFVDGVDASTWDAAKTAAVVDSRRQQRKLGYTPSVGAVGCYFAHQAAWRRMLAEGHQQALILEDDANPAQQLAPLLPRLAVLARALDILFLHDRRPARPSLPVSRLDAGIDIGFKRFQNIGGESYIISARAAMLLLAEYPLFSFEVDTLLNRWWETGLAVATTSPPLVTAEDQQIKQIEYSRKRQQPSVTQRVANRLERLRDSISKRLKYHAQHQRMLHRLAKVETNPQQRPGLLVIQPMVGIGDMVWHKPWLEQLGMFYNLKLMAKPSSCAAAVLSDMQNLETVVPLNRSSRGSGGNHDGIIGFLRLVASLRQQQVDTVFILHGSWRYAAAAMLAGIRHRLGYGPANPRKKNWQRHFLTAPGSMGQNGVNIHPRVAMAGFAERIGLVIPDPMPRITPSADAIQQAEAWLAGHLSARSENHRSKPAGGAAGGILVIMGIGAADAARRWPPQRFAGLIDRLARQPGDITIILAGSQAEKPIADAIIASLDATTPAPLVMTGAALETVIACHALCTLYIGNDTSLINIAAAVGTPAIRIFASTLFVLESSLITTVLPEDESAMDTLWGIASITEDQVLEAALPVLEASHQNLLSGPASLIGGIATGSAAVEGL